MYRNERMLKAWHDWHDAFEFEGIDRETAYDLANECEIWATNNPTMRWQDIFDAVLLTHETEGAE
jgi:hypothetical protein